MVRFPINLGLALILCAPAAGEAAAHRPPALSTTSVPTRDFLYAIRVVESGDHYDCPPGRYGEQGPYQFRRAVWRQYTRAPFAQARTTVADTVAARHYQWIISALRRKGIHPTVWSVAAAWNGGVENLVRGRISASTRSYAERVVNLVREQTQLRASADHRYKVAFSDVP